MSGTKAKIKAALREASARPCQNCGQEPAGGAGAYQPTTGPYANRKIFVYACCASCANLPGRAEWVEAAFEQHMASRN